MTLLRCAFDRLTKDVSSRWPQPDSGLTSTGLPFEVSYRVCSGAVQAVRFIVDSDDRGLPFQAFAVKTQSLIEEALNELSPPKISHDFLKIWSLYVAAFDEELTGSFRTWLGWSVKATAAQALKVYLNPSALLNTYGIAEFSCAAASAVGQDIPSLLEALSVALTAPLRLRPHIFGFNVGADITFKVYFVGRLTRREVIDLYLAFHQKVPDALFGNESVMHQSGETHVCMAFGHNPKPTLSTSLLVSDWYPSGIHTIDKQNKSLLYFICRSIGYGTFVTHSDTATTLYIAPLFNKC